MNKSPFAALTTVSKPWGAVFAMNDFMSWYRAKDLVDGVEYREDKGSMSVTYLIRTGGMITVTHVRPYHAPLASHYDLDAFDAWRESLEEEAL